MTNYSKAFLDIIILSVLTERDSYGYDIIKQVKETSEGYFEVGEGTLYPSLKRMEKKGYISSYYENIGQRKRKYYTITENGRVYLDEMLQVRRRENSLLDRLSSNTGGAFS
ncbi:PadR family transcriptional regulator [Salibacterium sp. K-3]